MRPTYLHANHEAANNVEVYLNGEKRLDIVEADSAEGWVRALVRGPDGKFVVNGDDFVTEIIRGEVRFVWLDGTP